MKEFDIKALGRRITFHREQLNLSRNDLHKLSGVSEGYLSNLENGIGSRLNIQTLCQIANALQLSVDELLIDSLEYFSLTNDTQVIMDIVNSFDEREAKMYLALIQDYFNSREN